MEPRGSSEPAAELPAGPEVAPEKGQQASKNNAPPPLLPLWVLVYSLCKHRLPAGPAKPAPA